MRGAPRSLCLAVLLAASSYVLYFVFLLSGAYAFSIRTEREDANLRDVERKKPGPGAGAAAQKIETFRGGGESRGFAGFQ